MTERLRTNAVIALVAALAVGGVTLDALTYHGAGFGSPALDAVVLVAVAANWHWSVLFYWRGASQSTELDDGILAMMLLVGAPLGLLVAILGGAFVAETFSKRRRPDELRKFVFNLASAALAIVVATFVAHAFVRVGAPPSGIGALGVLVATVSYIVVSAGAFTAILAALRIEGLRNAVTNNLIHLPLAIAVGALGVMTAFAYHANHLLVLAMVPPLLAIRFALSSLSRAHYDHERLRGLLGATLNVERAVGAEEVAASLCEEAKRLMRCQVAEITDEKAEEHGGAIVAELHVGEQVRFLVARGRQSNEPFDDADQDLFNALAAAGAAELENAALYEERQRRQEEIAVVADGLGEGVCSFALDGSVRFVNAAARRLLQIDGNEEAPAADEDNASFALLADAAQRVLASGESLIDERSALVLPDDSELTIEWTATPLRVAGVLEGAVVTLRDATVRLAFEERLEHIALTDELTGLPNRRAFVERLERALEDAQATGGQIAVFRCNVDRFKVVNDALGHRAGDEFIQTVGERLRSIVRGEDMLARFSGDEFTALVEGLHDKADAARVAERMSRLARQPVELSEGRRIASSLSVGVALAGEDANADDLLHDADAALAQAKRVRGGSWVLFDADEMASRSAEKLDLEAALRQAIAERALSTYFQPLFSAKSGELVGAEALVRWHHPERGLLPPAVFVPLAEETGLVSGLGELVLADSCAMARRWEDLAPGWEFHIAVNLSAQQFQDADLVAKVRSIVAAAQLRPERICLEVTETLALQDVDSSISTLEELKHLGVELALDDFGTGYSSLTYLKNLPVDIVKLDRSFVTGLAESPVDAAIVSSVIGLAHGLGLTTVAEGVETRSQLDLLRGYGCDTIQGYLLGRPMPEEDFARLVAARPIAVVGSDGEVAYESSASPAA